MNTILPSLLAGVLANLSSDGIEAGAKYVFSKRKMDLELRKSVNLLENRQVNIEGTIQRLINNQEMLIASFNALISQYQLQSRAYLENQSVIIVANPNDIDLLTSIILTKNQKLLDSNQINNFSSEKKDLFTSYRKYVREKRGTN